MEQTEVSDCCESRIVSIDNVKKCNFCRMKDGFNSCRHKETTETTSKTYDDRDETDICCRECGKHLFHNNKQWAHPCRPHKFIRVAVKA